MDSHEKKDRRITLVAGTRGSALALAQTDIVIDFLERKNRNLTIKTKTIVTSGDSSKKNKNSSLTGKDSFTGQIDSALRNGEIDFAVHSLKDVPVGGDTSRYEETLEIAAYPKRGSPFDALISRRKGQTLKTLPLKARIGTSSVRRAIQLKSFRPDFELVEIHGNVPTRIRKMRDRELELDAIILAKAGLDRLHMAGEIDEVIGAQTLLPAPGQGCLALSVRSRDTKTKKIVETIDDKNTRHSVEAERTFSSELGGGCNTPIAALANIKGSSLRLYGLIGGRSGEKKSFTWDYMIRDSIEGKATNSKLLGRKLGSKLKAMMI